MTEHPSSCLGSAVASGKWRTAQILAGFSRQRPSVVAAAGALVGTKTKSTARKPDGESHSADQLQMVNNDRPIAFLYAALNNSQKPTANHQTSRLPLSQAQFLPRVCQAGSHVSVLQFDLRGER